MPIPIERFETVPLFEGMSREEIATVLAIAEYVEAEVGDVLVVQGETGDGFFVIAAGAFEVVKTGSAGPRVLARLEELSFFGEMSLVSDQPRAASVVCVEAGRLKRVGLEPFRRLLQHREIAAYKVVMNMSRILARRLALLEEQLVR